MKLRQFTKVLLENARSLPPIESSSKSYFGFSRRASLTLGLLIFGLIFEGRSHADWPQFRGPLFNAVVDQSKLPVEFGGTNKKNVAWRVEIPGRSVGGVIVVGDQAITTASAGMDERRIQLLSFSAKDGSQLWEQEFVARGRPFCHPTSANAAPTPASDGKRVFAFFSSNDLACVDLNGNLIWYRSLASDFVKAGNDVGMSSSPVVVDGVCVVQVECQGDSFVAGLDVETGKLLWRNDRPQRANWSSPSSYRTVDGKVLVLMQSGQNISAVEPKTGKTVWDLKIECSTIPSALVHENRLFIPSSGIAAFDLSSVGSQPSELWKSPKLGIQSSSPVISKGRIYTVRGPVLFAGDIFTGEVKWQSRVAEGSVWSSPVIVGDRLYLFSMDGKCSVTKLGENEGERLALNELGEDVLGSPAIAGNAMFVRSISGLWKIAE